MSPIHLQGLDAGATVCMRQQRTYVQTLEGCIAKIHAGVARANKILIKILNKNRHTHSVNHQILCVTKGQHFNQYHKKAMA